MASIRTRAAALFCFALMLLAGCSAGSKNMGTSSTPQGGGTDAAPKVVRVFIWSDYHSPEALAEFEKKTGLKVEFSHFESNEQMLAKLQQPGGDGLYDIVVPSAHVVESLVKLDLVQPLDSKKLSNLGNLAPKFKDPSYDKGNKYTVPYFWGSTGILYRKDKLKELPATWATVFKDPPGTFVMLDEMRDMLGAALVYQGDSVNCKDVEKLKKAAELVTQAKKHPKFRFFAGGPDGQKKVLAGEVDFAVVWNGEGVRAMSEDAGVDFFIPSEGSPLWVDNLTIPKHAPNPDGAHKLIDFWLDGKIAAQQANELRYGSPVAAAREYLKAEDLNNPRIYPAEELMNKLQFEDHLGDDAQVWDELWTQIKSR